MVKDCILDGELGRNLMGTDRGLCHVCLASKFYRGASHCVHILCL